jgi:hypothetical protein
MTLYVLDLVLFIVGIRGHIPQNDNSGAGPNRSSFAASTSRLMRILAAAVVVVLLLSLVLWAAVWLAIKWL